MSALRAAAVVVVRDEEALVGQWLAFHLAIGFDTLFVLDHRSVDGTADVVDAFASRYDVRRLPWGSTAGTAQADGYEHVIARFGGEFDWMAFFDVDEYLVLNQDHDVHAFLERFGGAAAIGVNWAMFGSAGHVLEPPGLLIEAFCARGPTGFGPNRHVKSIVRPEAVLSCLNAHAFDVSGSYVTTDGRPVAWEVAGVLEGPATHEVAQLNHYFTRSLEDWLSKVARGRFGRLRRLMSEFAAYDQNSVPDRRAAELAGAVRAYL